jgi:hypothetical protein
VGQNDGIIGNPVVSIGCWIELFEKTDRSNFHTLSGYRSFRAVKNCRMGTSPALGTLFVVGIVQLEHQYFIPRHITEISPFVCFFIHKIASLNRSWWCWNERQLLGNLVHHNHRIRNPFVIFYRPSINKRERPILGRRCYRTPNVDKCESCIISDFISDFIRSIAGCPLCVGWRPIGMHVYCARLVSRSRFLFVLAKNRRAENDDFVGTGEGLY